MDVTSFLPLITGAIGGATTAGVFKGPIQTLEDWWYINFGHSQSEQANMLRVKQEANVEALKKQLLDDVSKIDSENIMEPKLNIIGPALEASRYYIEEESLRNMFSKLIASSMDKSKSETTRTSFVETIKQMEPIDAKNLLCILDTENIFHDLICEFRIYYSSGGYETAHSNVYLGNPGTNNQNLLGTSLENLARLGLIELTYQQVKNKSELYFPFEDTSEYKETKEYINSTNDALSITRRNNPDSNEYDLKLSGPTVTNGIIILTNYGKSFCSICL
ncbi:DUF4393 domain-containing protein [Oceanobacillus sojae]|uniref:DUF4393 domain-containing protein n=1 Tax=Oceanobacillus sojae TaxID=582851 RepID=UPI0021A294BB|nr:DUF4393 domain-containing protein [Oceanobacillus sojae]MCT1904092.1 DUF4393 domain-containing protein [Oceanobacillus sojae]